MIRADVINISVNSSLLVCSLMQPLAAQATMASEATAMHTTIIHFHQAKLFLHAPDSFFQFIDDIRNVII